MTIPLTDEEAFDWLVGGSIAPEPLPQSIAVFCSICGAHPTDGADVCPERTPHPGVTRSGTKYFVPDPADPAARKAVLRELDALLREDLEAPDPPE